MWICPKCGRQFKNNNQQHYCSDKPETIDAYIALQAEEKQEDLNLIRSLLRAALPEAEEKIAWSMPTYRGAHNIIHFAASAKHIGIYPGPEAVSFFEQDLKKAGYGYAKGTIRVPYGKVHADLITKIAKWCLETGHHA